MYGKVDMVKLLLDKHIDINIKDQEGCNVLEMLEKFTSARYEPIKALIKSELSWIHHLCNANRARSAIACVNPLPQITPLIV